MLKVYVPAGLFKNVNSPCALVTAELLSLKKTLQLITGRLSAEEMTLPDNLYWANAEKELNKRSAKLKTFDFIVKGQYPCLGLK